MVCDGLVNISAIAARSWMSFTVCVVYTVISSGVYVSDLDYVLSRPG